MNEVEGRRAWADDDPWDVTLPGANGFLAPYGGEYLLACTRGIRVTRKVLAIDPGAVVTQDASDGQNVKFHVRHFEAVAEVMRLRRRRQVSEAERERLAEAGKGTRFPGTGNAEERSIRAQTAEGDPDPSGGPLVP
jgi:hypothetical protein